MNRFLKALCLVMSVAQTPAVFAQSRVAADQSTIGTPVIAGDVEVRTGDTGASSFRIINAANAELFRVNADGKIAAGNTAGVAAHSFDINGTGVLNGAARELLGVYDLSPSAAGVGGGIVFGGRFDTAGTIAHNFGSIQGRKENGIDGNFASALVFHTRAHAGNPSERMRIDSSGRLGIGVTAPAAMLHVAGDVLATDALFTGNVTVNGNIAAKYQDVAEWVPVAADIAPGTVVILNPDETNEVMPSSGEYDLRVAGVVSEQPGLILGEAGISKEQIATTGRVRVKVDATAAPIRVGDLLVTSSKAGRAMRSDAIEIQGRRFHQPGTIIGKALEPLASGEGEILVLLSLQ